MQSLRRGSIGSGKPVNIRKLDVQRGGKLVVWRHVAGDPGPGANPDWGVDRDDRDDWDDDD